MIYTTTKTTRTTTSKRIPPPIIQEIDDDCLKTCHYHSDKCTCGGKCLVKKNIKYQKNNRNILKN